MNSPPPKSNTASRRRLLVLVILVLVNLSIIAYWILHRSPEAIVAVDQDLKEIPAVNILADTGANKPLTTLIGKVSLVQFVNPDVQSQLDSVSQMLPKFGADIWFVLITRDAHALRERLPALSNNVIVVQQDLTQLKRIFNVPDCCERRFVFNEAGKLSYSDYYYEADLTARINVLIHRQLPPLSDAVLQTLSLLPGTTFDSFKQKVQHTKSGKAAVAVFTSVCTSCQSGELVQVLNQYAVKRPDIRFIALLPVDYTNVDVENFKSNLQVKFPVERADSAFAREVSKLVSTYGQNRLNGIIRLIDRNSVSVIENNDEVDPKLAKL